MRPRLVTRAFTLFEILVTISIISIIAVLVAPAMHDSSGSRLIAASSLLVSDIELAQVLSIAQPDDRVVVRFEPSKGQWWLARAADPETPIPRPDNGLPYLVTLGSGSATVADGVTFKIDSIPAATLEFNTHGGLLDLAAKPRIDFTLSGRTVTVEVATTTGTVTESYAF